MDRADAGFNTMIPSTKQSVHIDRYLKHAQAERSLSENTLVAYRGDLERFNCYLSKQQENLLSAGEDRILEHIEKRKSEGLKSQGVARILSSLKGFYEYLKTQGVRGDNPTKSIKVPRVKGPVQRTHLSKANVDKILSAPPLKEPLGVRDRAILELIYTTAMHVGEIIDLKPEDFDGANGTIFVVGKRHASSRTIKLSTSAKEYLELHINWARAKLLRKRKSVFLFPGKNGKRMERQSLWHIVRKNVRKANINTTLSPAGFRQVAIDHMKIRGVSAQKIRVILGLRDY